jgi:L,D-transpeptidase catalytic domain/Putative peptidoglycan binding domain/PKD domain
VFAPAAHAAPPTVSAQASPARGVAPLQVTLTATGDGAVYHWDLGDGTTADGPSVQHVYGAGLFTARVTATSATGESAQADVRVTAFGITLTGPREGRYGERVRFRGRLVPGLRGARVTLYRSSRRIASVKTGQNGRFAVFGRVGRAESRYTARCEEAISNPIALAVRPRLDVAFRGSGQVGHRLGLVARQHPVGAGRITVRLWRDGRLILIRRARGRLLLPLSSARATSYRVVAVVEPAAGYLVAVRKLEQIVFVPVLGPGSRGRSVYLLERRLADLHYALGVVDGYYGADTMDAVIAFQKLHGLSRTGSIDGRFWRELQRARVPKARHGGDHVEVSKDRQVLFLVRNGRVTLVAPVSTGATGNTPVGVWHVYRRVAGWDGVLWYPTYFVGAFAIHGYPEVPAYPASHGCVRVPMWVAPRLFAADSYGTTVYIY